MTAEERFAKIAELSASQLANLPQPCRFCGVLIAKDATADWFATDPSAHAPWVCPVNTGGHAPAPSET